MTQTMELPAGHPSLSSTQYGEERWQAYLEHDLCAEESCLSAAECPGPECTMPPPPMDRMRGRVWYRNSHADQAFPEEYRKYCFTCAYWHQCKQLDEMHVEQPNKYHNLGIYVFEGKGLVRYSFNADQPVVSTRFSGFGGRTFYILMLDGTVWKTNNLWYQGPVPEWLRHMFEANAEFR
jgi:hypothetical protein